MDQEHGLGADDAAASVISTKEDTRARGRDLSLVFVSTQLNKVVCIHIIQKSPFLYKHRSIYTRNNPPV
jgi:hypothetical protein